jgi:hypothetical protein
MDQRTPVATVSETVKFQTRHGRREPARSLPRRDCRSDKLFSPFSEVLDSAGRCPASIGSSFGWVKSDFGSCADFLRRAVDDSLGVGFFAGGVEGSATDGQRSAPRGEKPGQMVQTSNVRLSRVRRGSNRPRPRAPPIDLLPGRHPANSPPPVDHTSLSGQVDLTGERR